MRHVLLGLVVAAAVAGASAPAEANGRRHHRGPKSGFHFGYAARPYSPYWRGYHRPRPVYYPAVPVYPAYPPPPPPIYRGPRAGFSYFSPGFSFSIAR